jgi:hypothetical protein
MQSASGLRSITLSGGFYRGAAWENSFIEPIS